MTKVIFPGMLILKEHAKLDQTVCLLCIPDIDIVEDR